MTKTYLEKRSMRVAGHRTSLALEPEFWSGVDAIARRLGTTPPRLIADIDAARVKLTPNQSLASAVRVYIYADAQRTADHRKALTP